MDENAIPEDVMGVARELASNWAMPETEGAASNDIARAILSEREAARNREMRRCAEAIVAAAKRVRELSPFPWGSGEPVAVGIQHLHDGYLAALTAIRSGVEDGRG